jgi:hypothetical protein
MTKQITQLPVLQIGNCEPLKAGVHATALGLFAIMGLYNAAAWLSRRDSHLAVNAVIYTALTAWEQQHVAHHVATLRRCAEAARAAEAVPVTAEPAPAAAAPPAILAA